MQHQKLLGIIILGVILVSVTSFYQNIEAEIVSLWIKNTALWYGEGKITETEFLNAIKFLIENKILVLDIEEKTEVKSLNPNTANVIIPNGNSNMGNAGFYIPLNLEISKGTTVVWINDDTVGHTVQSQDGGRKCNLTFQQQYFTYWRQICVQI